MSCRVGIAVFLNVQLVGTSSTTIDIKITTRKAPFYAKWRDDIINIVKQYREIDATFTQKVESGKKYICDRHFLPTDIQTNGE